MRAFSTSCLAATLALVGATAHAQEAADAPAPAEGAPQGDAPAAADAPTQPAETVVYREWERPVVVAAYSASDRVPAETLPDIAQAVATRLEPMVDRRSVVVIDDAEALAAIAACPREEPEDGATAEDGSPLPTPGACLGAAIAEAQGEVGAIVAVDRGRRRRSPWTATVTVRARETGAVRGEPVVVEIPQDGDAAVAVAEPLAALEGSMPAPPPRQFLLVAANVDGARVRVDETDLGETPVAAVELEPGRHVVTVAKDGLGVENRVVQMRPGQNVRINVDFEPEASDVRYDWETGEVVEDEEKPWYLRWYTIAAASAVVVGAIVVGVVVATSGDDDPPNPQGVPIPPLDGN